MRQGTKGQISLVLIIVVAIIVVGVGATLFFTGQLKANNERSVKNAMSASASGDADTSVVNVFVQDCLEISSINGIFELGRQGGYYHLPAEVIETEKGSIPYFYRSGKLMSLTHRKLITEYQDYLKDKLVKCADFSVLKRRGLSVKAEEPEVLVKLLDKETIIELTYPLAVTKEGKTQTLEKWTYILPFDYEYVFFIYSDISQTIYENPKYKDLTQLVSFTDYDVFVVPMNKTADIYILSTYLHGIDEREERYSFMFAVER